VPGWDWSAIAAPVSAWISVVNPSRGRAHAGPTNQDADAASTCDLVTLSGRTS
jgi:hypothetical protein